MLEAGGLDQVKEQVRDTWLGTGIETTIRDVHYAVRTCARSPGFTITALLSLALGIGANTAIFSILHALVLRSLPVSDPADAGGNHSKRDCLVALPAVQRAPRSQPDT